MLPCNLGGFVYTITPLGIPMAYGKPVQGNVQKLGGNDLLHK